MTTANRNVPFYTLLSFCESKRGTKFQYRVHKCRELVYSCQDNVQIFIKTYKTRGIMRLERCLAQ